MNLVDEYGNVVGAPAPAFSLVLPLPLGKLGETSNYCSFQTLYSEGEKMFFPFTEEKKYTVLVSNSRDQSGEIKQDLMLHDKMCAWKVKSEGLPLTFVHVRPAMGGKVYHTRKDS